jgi:hypothetical protein
MIIYLHRAEAVGIENQGEQKIVRAKLVMKEDGEPIGRIVDVPVPTGHAPQIGSTILVAETINEEGSYFDLARHTGVSMKKANQRRVMEDLMDNYKIAREQGIEDPAAWKFAITATIDD